jgi:hypothetical protein
MIMMMMMTTTMNNHMAPSQAPGLRNLPPIDRRPGVTQVRERGALLESCFELRIE